MDSSAMADKGMPAQDDPTIEQIHHSIQVLRALGCWYMAQYLEEILIKKMFASK